MSDLPRAFGPYTLLKLLAKGGMGEIFLARSSGISNFEKFYAIKKLLKKFARDPDVTARFIDEAKLGARLQHPNIVQVYDLGGVAEEMYMATEFVDGFDLRRVLRFCHEKKKRIPLDIALFIVREVLSGLAYAHRQVDAEGQSINLIHRDISPQNVLVSFEGEVKIIDFGLAKSTQRSQETQANVLLGNFGYMSPEQARGHNLDVRTDVYSAGIVLFELVTGTKRFVDENPLRLLEMVARPTPIMPSDRQPDLPRAVDRIYRAATTPDQKGRLAGAEEFRDQVTTALHRLNPRATREHLAQFLNHLFLGGVAPPTVDNDLLNKSVAVHVHDLMIDSAAFMSTKQDDVRNRTLTGFEDDGVQTGSHDVMRSARVGDTLSHLELTGQEGPPTERSAAAPEPVSGPQPVLKPIPVSAPPAAIPADAPMPSPQPLTRPATVAPAPSPATAAPISRAPIPRPAPPPSSSPSLIMPSPAPSPSVPSISTQPPASPPAVAKAPPPEAPPAPIAAPPVPRPDVSAMPPNLSALDELSIPPHTLEEDEPTVVRRPGSGPVPAAELDISLEALADAEPDAAALAAAESFGDPVAGVSAASSDAATSVYEAPSWPSQPSVEPAKVKSRLAELPPTGASDPATKPPQLEGRVVSMLADEPLRSDESEPTMVVDFDSLPGAEVVEAPRRIKQGGFGEGAGESLIIDFDASDDDDDTQAMPPSVPSTEADGEPVSKIRPAAQPRGKVATGKVVRPRRRPRMADDPKP